MKDVAPVYPAIAQSARVAGHVVIEATVDDEGKVCTWWGPYNGRGAERAEGNESN
jgi:hypothetical protein